MSVAGSPLVTLRVSAPTAALTQGAGPAGQLVLFVKVLDVAPDGTASLIHGLEAPIRVPDVTEPITVTLPGIVHQFAAGHSIQLVVAGGSDNYRGGLTPVPVTIASGAAQTLVLPTGQRLEVSRLSVPERTRRDSRSWAGVGSGTWQSVPGSGTSSSSTACRSTGGWCAPARCSTSS